MAPNPKRAATRERFLRWFAIVWAIGAYVVLLWVPIYGGMRETSSSDGVHTVTRSSATLVAVNGARVYWILAVPVMAAVLTNFSWPRRMHRAAIVVGAVLASAFVVLGLASVGLFFFPSAVALIVAAAVGPSRSRPGI